MQEELLKKLRYKQGRALVLQAPEGYKLGIEDRRSRMGLTISFSFLLTMRPRWRNGHIKRLPI